MSYDNINGSEKFIQWIHIKTDPYITDYKLYNEDTDLLVIEFNKCRYNYGLIYHNHEPKFISFGPTYESYDCEFRTNMIHYQELQSKYDNEMKSFHSLEKMIHTLLNNDSITLTTISLKNCSTSFTFFNIMILAIVINLNVYDIINNQYEQHIDPVFIKMINMFYDFDSSILVKPYIKFENQLCSKIIPITNISDAKIEFNILITKLATNNVATFPIFIDWMFIKPITSSFFNNKLINKKTNTAILLLNQYVGRTINYIDHIEICHVFELMYSLYALHVRCNVMHGNVNLTNITFLNTNANANANANVFILSEFGEYDTYVFPVSNITCYIIDFQNIIIESDEKIPYMIDYIELSKCLLSISKNTKIEPLLNQINKLANDILKNNTMLEIDMFRKIFNTFIFDKDDLDLTINSVKYIFN